MFVTVIIAVASDKYSSLPLKAVLISGSLTVLLKAVGGISGGCMNPAVGVVQTLGQMRFTDPKFKTKGSSKATYHYHRLVQG